MTALQLYLSFLGLILLKAQRELDGVHSTEMSPQDIPVPESDDELEDALEQMNAFCRGSTPPTRLAA